MKKVLSFLAAVCCSMTLMAQSYLSDGAQVRLGDKYMDKNFLRPGDVTELKQGTIAYDPENHVLTLSNVFIESADPAMFGLALSCSNMAVGSQKMEIRIVGSNIIRTTRDFILAAALMLGDGDYVITGMNGNLKLMSKNGIGLGLGCKDLIIRDGVYIHAGYSESDMQTNVGVMPVLATPSVTILCATLNAYGTMNCMRGVDPALMYADLTDAEKTDGYQYDSSKEYWVDGSDNALKGIPLLFEPTAHHHIVQWMNATPGGGTITVTDGGSTMKSPYYYGQDKESHYVDILATPNDGWHFMLWRACNGAFWSHRAAETTYGLPELVVTGLFMSYFRDSLHAAPTKPWYVLSEYYDKVVSFDNWALSPADVAENVLSDMVETKLKYATFAQGRLYFIDQKDTEKSGLYSVQFDPGTGKMSDKKTVVEDQNVFQNFYCLTYDFTDGFLYGVATKSDNEQYLVKINLKTNVLSAVGKITNTDMNNSVGVYLLAADNKGQLYGIFKVGETHNNEKSPYRHGSMLVKIDKTDATITPVGWTGQYFESPSCSMACDYKTGELIATSYSSGGISGIVSIDTQTGWATPLQEYTGYCNGIFQMMPNYIPVSVGVKSGDEDKGTAVLLETGKTEGKYFVGDEVDIEAFPATTEYKFVKWSDGNTENPRTVTVPDVAFISYTAEFALKEDVVPYPIWINDKQRQMTSLSGELNNGNCAYISGGSITFDPETNTLTLDNLDIEAYNGDALTIGDNGEEHLTITVNMVGLSMLATYDHAVVAIENADVTFTGEGQIQTQCYYASSAYILDHANLTFEGVNMSIDGNAYGIKGIDEASVLFEGASMSVRGLNDGAIAGLESMETLYCGITAPTGADFNPATHQVEDAGGIVKGMTDVVISAYPKIQCDPIEEGSGSFVLKSSDEEFENVGWFAAGTPITITAVPAAGFVFARWTDDATLPATRELTKDVADEALKALFYVETKEESKWFGVHKSKFVAFDLADYGASVAKATAPDGTSVTAGEKVGDDWIFVDGTDIKKMPFETLVDGQDLSGASSITTIVSGAPSGITDMAYSLSQEKLYAVAGSKLYQIEENTCTEVGTFEHNSITLSAVSIAIDADTIYILTPGDPGALYTVYIIDESLKKVYLEPVGEHNGSVDLFVGTAAQSMAFDPNVGQLLWGASDYMRYIHPKTAVTRICGDLEQSGGAQLPVISLHREIKKATIHVQCATGQESMGTVKITPGDVTTGTFVVGSVIHLIATPAADYKFVEWDDHNTEADRLLIVSESKTFIATFDVNTIKYTVKIAVDKGELDEIHGKVKVNDGDEKKKFEGQFEEGTVITVEAVPEEGYTLDEWSDDEDEKGLTREIEVTKNLDIKVSFRELRKYTLSVNIKPANGGKVELNGEVRENNQLKVTEGKSITAKAIPAQGFKFKGWENANGEIFDTDSEISIKMKSSREITAVFEEAQGIEAVSSQQSAISQKLLINGRLYILRDGKIYNVQGVRVE